MNDKNKASLDADHGSSKTNPAKSFYMNPEIKKFWEQIGVVDTDYVLSAPVSQELWCVYPDGNTEYDGSKPTMYVAHKRSDSEEIVYYLGGKRYNEEDMLKAIRMKAFI